MDAASEFRQAHRTAALITGGLITGLVMYAVIASVCRMSRAPSGGAASPAVPQLGLVRYAAWIASAIVVVSLPGVKRLLLNYLLGSVSLALLLVNAPRYEAWEAWLATPAPRP